MRYLKLTLLFFILIFTATIAYAQVELETKNLIDGPLSLKADVCNNGDELAEDVSVEFTIQGMALTTVEPTIRAGECKTVYSYIYQRFGYYEGMYLVTATAKADSDNHYREADESDNFISQKLVIIVQATGGPVNVTNESNSTEPGTLANVSIDRVAFDLVDLVPETAHQTGFGEHYLDIWTNSTVELENVGIRAEIFGPDNSYAYDSSTIVTLEPGMTQTHFDLGLSELMGEGTYRMIISVSDRDDSIEARYLLDVYAPEVNETRNETGNNETGNNETGNDNDTENQAPVAILNFKPAEGSAPLNVTFYVNESFDPDGYISSYGLSVFSDEGDVSVTTKTGVSDTAVGFEPYTVLLESNTNYTVILSVTDNDLASSSVNATFELVGESVIDNNTNTGNTTNQDNGTNNNTDNQNETNNNQDNDTLDTGTHDWTSYGNYTSDNSTVDNNASDGPAADNNPDSNNGVATEGFGNGFRSISQDSSGFSYQSTESYAQAYQASPLEAVHKETVEVKYIQPKLIAVDEKVCKLKIFWWCVWWEKVTNWIPAPAETSNIPAGALIFEL